MQVVKLYVRNIILRAKKKKKNHWKTHKRKRTRGCEWSRPSCEHQVML